MRNAVPKRGKAAPKIAVQKIEPQKKDNTKLVDSKLAASVLDELVKARNASLETQNAAAEAQHKVSTPRRGETMVVVPKEQAPKQPEQREEDRAPGRSERAKAANTLEEEIEKLADEYRRIARFDMSLGLWNA